MNRGSFHQVMPFMTCGVDMVSLGVNFCLSFYTLDEKWDYLLTTAKARCNILPTLAVDYDRQDPGNGDRAKQLLLEIPNHLSR